MLRIIRKQVKHEKKSSINKCCQLLDIVGCVFWSLRLEENSRFGAREL